MVRIILTRQPEIGRIADVVMLWMGNLTTSRISQMLVQIEGELYVLLGLRVYIKYGRGLVEGA